MQWRERIARWICPELGRQADRWFWLNLQISELRFWLTEFDQASIVLQHLRIAECNWFRKIDDAPIPHEDKYGRWPSTTYEFREKMRRVFLPAKERV